jgi:Na+-transporting methylmalonyl-CoA/oxaloacetate decarboxylase gamma subunit
VSSSLSTLLALGAIAALVVIAWSFTHWRAAVKVAFVAVILEGAIRKWVFPQGQELVYFLKDVFLVGAYLKFYFAPDPEIRAFRLRVPGMLILLLTGLVCIGAVNANLNSALLAVYGVKIYFMYLPLVFMMPYLFRTQREMVRQTTWYALIAIPVCVLGVLQWYSDTFSLINTFSQGMSEAGATTFGFGDHARITGTFSYLTGHTTFVIVFGTLHLALLSLLETPKKWLLMLISLPLLAGNALMGGSRSSVLALALVAGGFALARVAGRVGSSRNYLTVLGAAVVFAVGAIFVVFTEAWSHWALRYQVAGDTVKSRVVEHPVEALVAAWEQSGFVGYGIGATHPATDAIRTRLHLPMTQRPAPVFDSESAQVLVEVGLVGFIAWYALRLLLVWLTWKAFLRAPPGPFRVIALASVLVAVPHLLMSVVFNHTANFLVFGLTGAALVPLLESKQYLRAARGSRLQGQTLRDSASPEPAQPPAAG